MATAGWVQLSTLLLFGVSSWVLLKTFTLSAVSSCDGGVTKSAHWVLALVMGVGVLKINNKPVLADTIEANTLLSNGGAVFDHPNPIGCCILQCDGCG